MKKAILFVPVLFIAITVVASCTKKCTCNQVLNGEKLIKDVEMEKYKKKCEDQSDDYTQNIYIDSLGREQVMPDTVPHFVCE